MKCDMAPETLISLLYDELDLKDEKKVRKHLEGCTTCRKIFQELQQTTNLLGQWEDETPAMKTVFIHEPATIWQSWKDKIRRYTEKPLAWSIPVLASAAVIFLFIFHFQVKYENGNWQIAFGKNGPSKSQIEAKMEAKLETKLSELQSRNMEQLVTLIQESEARQRRDFSLALNEFSQQQELRRQQDLQLVGQGLQGLHRQTEGRYHQTSTLINDLIRMTSSPDSQP
ncbi:hypothetical protein JW835_14365 [bacterium]|nr:hypothetical protein [bacterium]